MLAMQIDEALPYLRTGNVMRCKNRYYVIWEGVLFRVWVPKGSIKAELYGEATLHGRDFSTDCWAFTNVIFDRGEYE